VWNQLEAAIALETTTTNMNEGFHSGFRKAVVENASFWAVVDDLKRMETKTKVKFDEDAGRGQAPNARQKKSELAAQDLKAVIESRLTFPTKAHYLKRLGHRIE
jgi:hypothetical protein